MRKLKTNFGTLYYEKAHKSESFKYVLLDSDKNWCCNINNKKQLEYIKSYKTLDDFLKDLYKICIVAESLEELLPKINELIDNVYEQMTMLELVGNEWLNHYGNNYVFIWED